MNAAIRALKREALAWGVSVTGFFQGYAGVFQWKVIDLTARAVGGIRRHGGTWGDAFGSTRPKWRSAIRKKCPVTIRPVSARFVHGRLHFLQLEGAD